MLHLQVIASTLLILPVMIHGYAAAERPAIVNEIDAELLEQLGPDARLIIAGNRPAELTGPGPSPHASIRLLSVEGESFTQAVRVAIREAVDPVWDAQITSPSTTGPIRRGDTLYGMIDVRGESNKESGGAQFTAWLQAPEGRWRGLRKLEGAPGGRWSRRFFTAVAEEDFAAGEVNLVFHLGVIPQTFEAANILLWNLGPDADLDALPRTRLTYEGQSPDAPWRIEAQRMIDRHRKADLTIEITDREGRPILDAEVEVELQRHAFGFGTFISNDSAAIKQGENAERYREILTRYFNRVTAPTYGAQTWGWPNPEVRQRYLTMIDWAHDAGFDVKTHPVLWSRFDWMPAAWSDLQDDPAALRAAINDYILELMTEVSARGVLQTDMVNEPVGFHQFEDVIQDPAMRADWFTRANEIAPSVALHINEHTILSAGGMNVAKHDAYANVIQDLLDRGAPVSGIGMQAHMGEDFTPPAQLWRVLDRFAAFGLPIHITEFDINTDDDLTQGEYHRDFMLAVFAHPAVESITLWGFWEPQVWFPQATMWRSDWSTKPNAEAFVELMTETLHTHGIVRTDASGRAVVRGFHGEYLVTVQIDGKRVEARPSLGKADAVVELTLP
ncbi:MAG: endo-1,4-beta-xylanase [Planctomycetota bacterium]